MSGARVIPIRPLLGPGDRDEHVLAGELTTRQVERLLRERGLTRLSMRFGALVLVSAERDGRVHHADGRDLTHALTRLLAATLPGGAS